MLLAVVIAVGSLVAAAMIVGFVMGAATTKAAADTHHKDCQDLTCNEMTMHKVYRSLMDNEVPKQRAIDIVSSMGNSGILFRERIG